MICNQYQELVSDYIDGSLELGEQLQVERHLADCEACRAVRDDLLQIVHFSRQLPLQTPSNAVWARIRSEVAAEPRASLWSRTARRLAALTSHHFNLSIPQLVASAAALAIVASVTVTLLRQKSLPGNDSVSDASRYAYSQDASRLSHRDMQQYEQRIDELTQTVEQRKEAWDPELRAAFQRNMIYIEQSLVECRHDLADDPGDDASQELMRIAYSEKVRLLEGFAKF